MKVTEAKFVTTAVAAAHWPEAKLPEIAFAGRSNVGKSSLINSLTNRHGLVKVSKTPGKTRALNFFSINGRVGFVDMPGYGYAEVPAAEKRRWGTMIEEYLKDRATLKGIVLLLDCRRKPNEDDRMLLEWIAFHGTPLVVVFTKIDKIPRTHRKREVGKAMAAVADLTGDAPVLTYSSLKGEGKRELWGAIRSLIGG